MTLIEHWQSLKLQEMTSPPFSNDMIYPDIFLALSGGLDSTALLLTAAAAKVHAGRNPVEEIKPVVFSYGNKAADAEIRAATNICMKVLGVLPTVLYINPLENISDTLDVITKDSAKTVYPFRNAILISYLTYMAARYGLSRTFEGYDEYGEPIGEIWEPQVLIGVHKGDITDYPDTRPKFIEKMASAVSWGTEASVALRTPFLHLPKSSIVSNIAQIPGWEEAIALTSSCYHAKADDTGKIQICGECPSCEFRAKAFAEAGIEDPIRR